MVAGPPLLMFPFVLRFIYKGWEEQGSVNIKVKNDDGFLLAILWSDLFYV